MTPYERRADLINKAVCERYASLNSFALSIGISRTTLYHIMSGYSRGATEYLLKIADALNLQPRDLLISQSQPRHVNRMRRIVAVEPLQTIERSRLIEAVSGTRYATTLQQCYEILYGPNADLAEQLRINLGLLHRSLYRRPEEPADTDEATMNVATTTT